MSPSKTTAHSTSIAVWDVPSPVVVNSKFRAKVGLKCGSACPLTRRRIVILDETGTPKCEARLGETPWPGTSALYVAQITLSAPPADGLHNWSATSPAATSEASHSEASTRFTFRTARPPEHRFKVTVVDADTEGRIANVQIRLGIYRSSTDQRGQASLDVPKGHYDLDVRRVGYEALSKTVDVTQDVTIQVEMASAPDKDPDDGRVWM